jgi:hypothetical protein
VCAITQWVSLNPTNIFSRKLLQLALCLGKVQADLGALLGPKRLVSDPERIRLTPFKKFFVLKRTP